MKFYTKYNVPPKIVEDTSQPSMTCQEFKNECDINNIVKMPNYGINPLKPPTRKPMYGDFTDLRLSDFQHAQNIIANATQLFEQMDSRVRERFGNDPAKMLEFVEDPKNYKEGLDLGLFEAKETMTDTVVSPSESIAETAVQTGSEQVRE